MRAACTSVTVSGIVWAISQQGLSGPILSVKVSSKPRRKEPSFLQHPSELHPSENRFKNAARGVQVAEHSLNGGVCCDFKVTLRRLWMKKQGKASQPSGPEVTDVAAFPSELHFRKLAGQTAFPRERARDGASSHTPPSLSSSCVKTRVHLASERPPGI